MISFLSRTIDFFFFFLSLWIYLWLAETSQQPISQTTWLKVTPHCNHCNHMVLANPSHVVRQPPVHLPNNTTIECQSYDGKHARKADALHAPEHVSFNTPTLRSGLMQYTQYS
jgi:hypothetical protein